jgi:hypothetical protein
MGRAHHHPVGLLHYEPRSCFRGYTLFCADGAALMIDMEGRICRRWENERGLQYVNLLDNGHLLCRASPSREVEGQRGLNGQTASVFEMDWDGNVVWEYEDPWLHHDHQRLANGNTLLIRWERMSEELSSRVQGGYVSEDDNPQMLGDVIIEVAPDGSVVREWKSWEHLDVEEDVRCPLEHRMEWTHCNSIYTTPDEDWIVSLRSIDTIAVIDPESGAFKWKWGRGAISHQHDAKFLESGNVMLFDNGVHARGPAFSRVLEIDPESKEIVWTYRANPAMTMFSFMGSGADRLPNGNTLICECQNGRMFEVTRDRSVVWEYINPFFIANPRLGDTMNMVFRAHRYGPNHPALADKDLDPAQYANLNRLYA